MKRNLILIASIFMLAFGAAPNAGAQWVLMSGIPTGGPDGGELNCFAVSDTTLFVATTNDGFYRTTNYGENWLPIEIDSLSSNVVSLAVNGSNIFVGSDMNGVWRSTDSGLSWKKASTGLPLYARAWALECVGTKLYTGLLFDSTYVSDDSGNSWEFASLDPPHGLPITGSGSNGSFHLMATDSGDFLSTNNGIEWTMVSLDSLKNPTYLALMDTILIAVADGGAFLSIDKGASWNERSSGLSYDSIDHYYLPGFSGFEVNGRNAFIAAGGIFLLTEPATNWISVSLPPLGQSLAVCGPYLFTNSQGEWRRPLSDFDTLNESGVAEQTAMNSQIQSYPNPFSQATTVTFSSQTAGFAEVTVVNLLGAQVAKLFSGELSAREHSFAWDASGMSPGMYECIVRMNGQVERVGMVLDN